MTKYRSTTNPAFNKFVAGLDWLKYAPLSVETFEKRWNSDSIISWNLLLENPYFPPDLFEAYRGKGNSNLDTPFEDRIRHLQNRSSSLQILSTEFLELLFSHPNAPREFLLSQVTKHGYKMLEDGNLSPKVFPAFLDPKAYENFRFNAAIHPNTPIELAASTILDNWPMYANQWEIEQQQVEDKCNLYLSAHGWDAETLNATPLKIKLSIIG